MNGLKELRMIHEAIKRCTDCPLHRLRQQAVPGEGPSDAELMFIGEAPGAEEDRLGRPFVGRSGRLLTEMLSEIGLSRGDVFITSVLKCRPPHNRTPTTNEIHACRHHLEHQMAVISPRIVVLLGSVSLTAMIGPWKITEAHGRFYEASDGRTFFMTFHPAAALRQLKYRQMMRDDLRILQTELGSSGG